MDMIKRVYVSQGLRSGPAIDRLAAVFCSLMTDAPVELHEVENNFKVSKLDDFNFSISVHHREIRSVYSHVFASGQAARTKGRYQFYAVPMKHEVLGATPPSILTFAFEATGQFLIGGLELNCEPPTFHKSTVRNAVITNVVAELQRALAE